MRYIIGFCFLFLGVVGFGQVERTAGIAIGTTVPTHTPSTQGALKYYNRSSGVSYRWTGSAWTVETVDLSGYLQWSDTATLATKHYVDSQGFLTAEVDGSITNEIQDLSISGTTLSLSGDASTVDLSGIGLISGGVAGYLVQYTGATSQDTISAYWDATTGRLGVGIASSLLARLHVKGPSTTSSTTALLVENSAGTDGFRVLDNGSTITEGIGYTLGYNHAAQRYGFSNGAYPGLNYGYIRSFANGIFSLVDAAESDFNRLCFGGTSGSYPSLKRVTTNFEVKLANDTYGAGLSVGGALEASAIFEVESTTKGLLPPRGTTAQMNAIASPAEGLMFYDLTVHKLYVYDGTAWQACF